jgi:hypothetical protein
LQAARPEFAARAHPNGTAPLFGNILRCAAACATISAQIRASVDAIVRLFGELTYFVVLSDHYDGADFCTTLVYDASRGEENGMLFCPRAGRNTADGRCRDKRGHGLERPGKKERDRSSQQIEGISAALLAFGEVYGKAPGWRKGTISAAGREAIRTAQKKRWAKLKGASGQANAAAPKQRRPMLAATRKKVAAAQRARWAKVRAGKK